MVKEVDYRIVPKIKVRSTIHTSTKAGYINC